MLTHAILIAAALTAGHSSQRPKPVRVLAYNPAALEQFNKEQESKLQKEPTQVVPVAETSDEKVPSPKPGLAGPSYVNISGNFGGVFYVSGVGSSTSQTQTNTVNIITNRALTFSANSFKPLALGNTSEAAMGSISYSMSLFQGNSSHPGVLVAGPIGGIDAGFNGKMLSVNAGQVQANGTMVLVITRTLSLTGQATGATTLVGTGYIGVTIN